MYDYFSRLQFMRNNDELCTLFFKYCNILRQQEFSGNSKDLISKINNIVLGNKLGPITFVTPELGRWSTVGGLGIMVDELSQVLVLLG